MKIMKNLVNTVVYYLQLIFYEWGDQGIGSVLRGQTPTPVLLVALFMGLHDYWYLENLESHDCYEVEPAHVSKHCIVSSSSTKIR